MRNADNDRKSRVKRRLVAATILAIASGTGVREARANNDFLQFGSGPMKNLYVDLIFWGPTCTTSPCAAGAFSQTDRTNVMNAVTDVSGWMQGNEMNGFPFPAGQEPAVHYYGPSGITPGMWLNDPMPISTSYMQGSSGHLDDGQFRPIVTLAQNGTLGPAYDYNNNVANSSGLPVSSNRVAFVVTKGTNNYCISSHRVSGCLNASGYHDSMSGHPYGAIMIEDTNPVVSHEATEAMSDPLFPSGLFLTPNGWGAHNGVFSTNEMADECENQSWGNAYAWITMDTPYAMNGFSVLGTSCTQTIAEQHAPLAAAIELAPQNGSAPLVVAFIDPNGHVKEMSWGIANGGHSAVVDLGQPSSNPSVKASGKPSMVYSNAAGGEYLFVKGTDGGVWMHYNGSWTPLGGLIYGDPKAVAWSWNGNTWIHVAVLGLDDNLYTQGVLNGTPEGWGQVPAGGALFVSSPTILSRGPNKLDVFATGEDGSVKWLQYNTTSNWQGPTTLINSNNIPVLSTPTAAADPNGVMTLFGTALNSTTWDTSFNGSTWATQEDAKFELPYSQTNLNNYGPQGSFASVSWGAGHFDAFAVSRAGELWWWYRSPTGLWTNGAGAAGNTSYPLVPSAYTYSQPPNPLVPSNTPVASGDPVAISRDVNEVEAFYRTQNGSLEHLTYSGGHWSTETVVPSALDGTTFYDPPLSGGSATQCTAGGSTMHCCPSGSVMVGANVGGNVFKCAHLSVTAGNPTLDTSTQRNSMHSCPSGQAMIGLSNSQNYLACVTLPANALLSERVDSSTQDVSGTMHACDTGTPNAAMSGINVGANLLSCATTAQIQ